ncbi:hypothetical protein DPMN_096400 [Dreissena polymorpha]|uniref:Uncharacterized protein n=1 Tax=Dreissena polymorpha TaxID=45954 RepID=A0A9D4L8A3_DREPO|nr:hypothetical protein DPMN_096400 [Dreissena polymorpha]
MGSKLSKAARNTTGTKVSFTTPGAMTPSIGQDSSTKPDDMVPPIGQDSSTKPDAMARPHEYISEMAGVKAKNRISALFALQYKNVCRTV